MRVIIATDGSTEADLAAAVFSKLPLPKHAKIKVATVTHLPVLAGVGFSPDAMGAYGASAADTWRIQRQVARQTIDHVTERLRGSGLDAAPVLLEGNTSDALLELVHEDKADVICVGCGVNSNFAAFFLGSVSRKLVLYSEASVLVGRHYPDFTAEGSFKRLMKKEKLDVMIAVDGSKGSELALDTLAQIDHKAFDNLYVVSVEPLIYTPGSMDLAAVLPTYDSDRARVDALARTAAEKIEHCAEHVHWLSSFGRPSVEITRLAAEKKVDLIMLSANRHGAIERFLLGSCAYETATSAPCSVLILRDVLPLN
jgi:universal stress protein A